MRKAETPLHAESEPRIFLARHMNKGEWLTAALDTRVPDDTIKLLLAMSYEATPGNFAQKEKGAAFNWCVAKKKGRPYLYDRAAEKQSAGDAGEKRKENPPQDRPCGGFFVFA